MTTAAADFFDDVHMARAVTSGFPIKQFFFLKDALCVSQETLSTALHLPSRTMARRQEEGKLKPDESERLLRYLRLYTKALEIFESQERTRKWFLSPIMALGGETPFDFASTEPGSREVEKLLGRLEHGVFS